MVTKGICYSKMLWAEQFYAEALESVSVFFPLINLRPVSGKLQTHKRFKRTLFIWTKHMHIFWVVRLRKLQNDT